MTPERFDASTGAPVSARLNHLAPEILAGLPFGVLVADRNGCMLAWNAATKGLLGDDPRLGEDAREGDVRCCELFGCRSGEGPLGDACITELALEADGALPEVRVDVPRDGAAWVVAAETGPGLVTFQVRPASRSDRRRRTDPHWVAGPQLHIRVLGRTRVRSGETSLGGRWLAQ